MHNHHSLSSFNSHPLGRFSWHYSLLLVVIIFINHLSNSLEFLSFLSCTLVCYRVSRHSYLKIELRRDSIKKGIERKMFFFQPDCVQIPSSELKKNENFFFSPSDPSFPFINVVYFAFSEAVTAAAVVRCRDHSTNMSEYRKCTGKGHGEETKQQQPELRRKTGERANVCLTGAALISISRPRVIYSLM